MCSYSSHTLRGMSPHSLFYSHLNTIPLFVEKSYNSPFIDVPRITSVSTMYIKAYFLNQSNILSKSEKRMKMTVNSKIKHKSKTMLGVIKNLVLDFVLYFVTAYMRKYPILVTSAPGTTQNTLYIT